MSHALNSLDELRSKVSESELSSALNTTAFDTLTHATRAEEPEVSTIDEVVVINGKTYLTSA